MLGMQPKGVGQQGIDVLVGALPVGSVASSHDVKVAVGASVEKPPLVCIPDVAAPYDDAIPLVRVPIQVQTPEPV
jgi:hypothetical protein